MLNKMYVLIEENEKTNKRMFSKVFVVGCGGTFENLLFLLFCVFPAEMQTLCSETSCVRARKHTCLLNNQLVH